jgi:hypothetical protein
MSPHENTVHEKRAKNSVRNARSRFELIEINVASLARRRKATIRKGLRTFEASNTRMFRNLAHDG